MGGGLRRRMLLATAGLAVLVALAFGAMLLTLGNLRQTAKMARHSEEVIATANRLEVLTLDLETGQRGYTITGDSTFLEPWNRSRLTYPGVARRLEEMVSDNASQEFAARALHHSIDRYRDVWASRVVAVARTNLPRARALVATGEGRRRIESIRREFTFFVGAEDALARQRQSDTRYQGALAIALGGAGLGGSLLLVLLFGIYLARRVVEPIRHVVGASGRIAAGELSARVADEGPGEIGELGRTFNAMADSLERNRRELDEQNEHLERLANVNRAVLDASTDGIALTDADGYIQLANAPMARLVRELGFRREGTIYDRLLSVADRITDPDDYRTTMARLRENPLEPSSDEYDFSDTGRAFLGFTGPVRDDRGTFIGRLWTLREVTTARQLERLKDEFVATVSHELRTPLTSIMGFIEMILDGEAGPVTEDQQRFLEIVKRSSDRLMRLVGDLLFVAQLDATGLSLQPADVELHDIVRECVEAVGPLSSHREIDVELNLAPVPTLRADGQRIEQLLNNLLSNALKFTPEGGLVVVRTRVEGEIAVLEVADSGIGIPDAEQSRVFQRFFRSSTATAQAIPGTGLGLVITKAIVEAHGGSIAVSSEANGGTCFRIELPLVSKALDAPGSLATTP